MRGGCVASPVEAVEVVDTLQPDFAVSVRCEDVVTEGFANTKKGR